MQRDYDIFKLEYGSKTNIAIKNNFISEFDLVFFTLLVGRVDRKLRTLLAWMNLIGGLKVTTNYFLYGEVVCNFIEPDY